MKWFEVIEDLGDGSNATRRFKTEAEAIRYVEINEEWCYDGYDQVDTDSSQFFDEVE
jgi:hypothetical protein